MKHFFFSVIFMATSTLAVAQDGEAQNPNQKTIYPDRSQACDPEHVYSKTDVVASYKGGVEQLKEDINNELSLDKKVAGLIYVSIIINCTDKAYAFDILRGLDSETDQAIVAVLKGLQNWTTGSQKGTKVDYSIGLFLKFKKGKVVDIDWPEM